MKRHPSISSLLIAGVLMGFTGLAEVFAQSDPGQQGVGFEGADTSSVILDGPETVLGRIEKIEGDGFVVHGDRDKFMKVQLHNYTNIVCPGGSEAKLTTNCNFKPGDLVLIEATDVDTTITRLASEEELSTIVE